MVGPPDKPVATENIPNLHFLGVRNYKEMPAYIDNFDVCVIPFMVSELIHCVNPVKLYEYFAFGKPVVATDMPEVGRFAEVCYISRSKEEFLANVEMALAEDNDGQTRKMERRLEIARGNTWRDRWLTVSTTLAEMLADHRRRPI